MLPQRQQEGLETGGVFVKKYAASDSSGEEIVQFGYLK
jgi:hypothetical protein